MTVDVVDGRVLETEKYAAAVPETHASGAPPRATRPARARPVGPRVRSRDRRSMRDREVGEIEICGASVTPGYFRRPDATAAAFHDGWLRTGDLGYIVDGELVVCGRIKDVIIVGGRNVFPEDIERAVADVDGVRAGNVIAFGTVGRRGRESIVVVAEARDADTSAEVRSQLRPVCAMSSGCRPRKSCSYAAGTLPKTSSGKLQRTLCRERYLGDSSSRSPSRALHHRPGVAVVALVGLREHTRRQQVLDARTQRVELEAVEQRPQPRVELTAIETIGEALQISSHGLGKWFTAEVPDHGAELPLCVERDPVVDARRCGRRRRAGSGRPCGRCC